MSFTKYLSMFDKDNQKTIKKKYLKATLWSVALGAVATVALDAWYKAGVTAAATHADQAAQNCGADVYKPLAEEIWRMNGTIGITRG